MIGCDSPNFPKRGHEPLVFNVDEALLEPPITDQTLKIAIAAPKEWKTIDESLLSRVVDSLDTPPTEGFQIVPRWIFVNEDSLAMCVVSRVDGAEIPPNAPLLKTLETAYRSQFPKATVEQTIFMKDAFRVHQLMVVASDFVLIKLICNAPESEVFEVDYRVPRDVYATELRAIESSIGSITLITHEP